MSAVPGINASHAIITPTCRQNKTDLGAFWEAVDRARAEYITCLNARGPDDMANYHIVLSVERRPSG